MQNKLKDYLNASCNYGYPEEYRNVIWCVLLQLPINSDTFLVLRKQDQHPVAKKFEKRLKKINLPKEYHRSLKSLISQLANWSPIFAEIDYIPGLVFPFLKIFPESSLITFEIVATILLNYGQLWFEFLPLEPCNFLGMCENVLMTLDTGLANFYFTNRITPEIYAFKMIETSFSRVFPEHHWYVLWDTIISNPPYFQVFLIVAFNVLHRTTLMKLQCREEIEDFFLSFRGTDIKKMIKIAHEYDDNYPEYSHPKKFFHKFVPMPKYYYPVFDNYPKDQTECDDVQGNLKRQIADLTRQEMELNANSEVMMEKLEEELRNTENARQTRGWYFNIIFFCIFIELLF